MQLRAENISFRYDRKSPWILKNVDLTLDAGERVALTGPSGCGKSTLSKILAGYLEPTEGQVLLDGKPLPTRGYSPVQLIYQHPEQAVNPRWKMERTLKECWEPDEELLKEMGIESEWLKRWSSELSGGELQRFCIARVLGPQTRFLVCDEITTMLDVITQAQIWELLLERASERNLGMAVVTHNMALAEKVCSRIVSLPDINGLR
ncbi:MAG: ATP-binding cassette domain-containing protein [Eubacteriales bacterium]|nr:ATP-binding cassette domain-containing protein [Eubacteriales bacterium]